MLLKSHCHNVLQSFQFQLLKSIAAYDTSEKLKSRLLEVEKDNKKLQGDIKQGQKSLDCIAKEKENLQRELNKNVLMRFVVCLEFSRTGCLVT